LAIVGAASAECGESERAAHLEGQVIAPGRQSLDLALNTLPRGLALSYKILHHEIDNQ
jgi:hypothetical protein